MMSKKSKTVRLNNQSSEYVYANIDLQQHYREWLKEVKITEPYALTLTSSRADMATQNQFANMKRISIR